MNSDQMSAMDVRGARRFRASLESVRGSVASVVSVDAGRGVRDWKTGWAWRLALVLLLVLVVLPGRGGEALPADDALQARIDEKRQVIQAWAQEPVVVGYVRAHNAAGGGSKTGITQEKWKTLSVLDPLVRSFTRNPAASLLRERKTEVISEAFISGADGTKAAFLSKPSNWNHQGKPKHELPMAGKSWQGLVEMDESTGLRQVQISVPVLDGGVPIGSLVVGLKVTKLGHVP